MGLQFIDCPIGFTSRHVVEINGEDLRIDSGAFLHHLPNLYANNSGLTKKFFPVSQLICE